MGVSALLAAGFAGDAGLDGTASSSFFRGGVLYMSVVAPLDLLSVC